MPIPQLPERRVRITDATRTRPVADFRAAIFDDDFVDRVVDGLLDELDLVRGCLLLFVMLHFRLLLLGLEPVLSTDLPTVLVVRLLRLVGLALASDGDVHAEADAHVRVGELLFRIGRLQQVHGGSSGDRFVRPDALVVVVVLDVAVGTLDADVHAFADGAVGQVRIGLVPGRQPDVVDLHLDAPVLQVPVFTLE